MVDTNHFSCDDSIRHIICRKNACPLQHITTEMDNADDNWGRLLNKRPFLYQESAQFQDRTYPGYAVILMKGEEDEGQGMGDGGS